MVEGECSSLTSCPISVPPGRWLSHFASKYGEREDRVASGKPTDQTSHRRIINEAFVPPNPNELESTVSMVRRRA